MTRSASDDAIPAPGRASAWVQGWMPGDSRVAVAGAVLICGIGVEALGLSVEG